MENINDYLFFFRENPLLIQEKRPHVSWLWMNHQIFCRDSAVVFNIDSLCLVLVIWIQAVII